jgi:GNAT superfamily N-acetyltransferase
MPAQPSELVLDDVSQAAEDPFAALNTILSGFNEGHIGAANHVPLWLFARDAKGRVQGGLRGRTYWGWCAIDVLAVAEPYRQQGIGSALLSKAESVARDRGCVGIHLDTVDFQAPEFYRRKGYVEFGRIDGFPPGHVRVWLMKKFATSA